MVATRARLRFTDAIQNKSIARSKPTIYHQTVSSVLTGCLTFRDKRTHICTLYDVGPNYLVMELVEGKPIAGPISAEQTIEYGCQILVS